MISTWIMTASPLFYLNLLATGTKEPRAVVKQRGVNRSTLYHSTRFCCSRIRKNAGGASRARILANAATRECCRFAHVDLAFVESWQSLLDHEQPINLLIAHLLFAVGRIDHQHGLAGRNPHD